MPLTHNRNFHYHKQHNIIVIWQAKAACTSVLHMLFEEDNLLNTALNYSEWIHHYRRKHQSDYVNDRISGLCNNTTKYINA